MLPFTSRDELLGLHHLTAQILRGLKPTFQLFLLSSQPQAVERGVDERWACNCLRK